MNKIEFGEEITLNNDQVYICFGNITYQNQDYIYLMNKNNKQDMVIAKQNNNEEIEFITDKEVIDEINKIFHEKNRI